MPLNVTVRVKGLEEVQRKLDGRFLVQPEFDHIADALAKRIGRPRKTKGFINNPLDIAVRPMPVGAEGVTLATIGSPLNRPRTKGTSWLRFIYGLARGSFMSRQVASAVKKINERWAS